MPGNIAVPPPEVFNEWPTPDYVNPERRTWVSPFGITLHIIATILIAARLWLRARQTHGGLGFDDALLIPSWLLATAALFLMVYATSHGLSGIHVWDLRFDLSWEAALNAWLSYFVFLWGTCCLRVSVLYFSLRMLKGSGPSKWRLAIWIAIGFTIAWTLAFALSLIFVCKPTEAYWMSFDIFWATKHSYQCADTRLLNPLAGVFSIISDLYSIVIPCMICAGLALSRKQKIGLFVLFGASLITVAAAAGRTWALNEIGHNYDATWHSTWVYFCANLEFELGLICTCIPTLRALFKSGMEASRAAASARSARQGGSGSEPYVSLPDKAQHSASTGKTRSNTGGSQSSFATVLPKEPSVYVAHRRDGSWIEMGNRM